MSIPSLYLVASELVQTRITGFRKGTSIPTYTHSQHVYETLSKYNLPEDVTLAGLLHDIIEDSNTTLDELTKLGFSSRTIALVSLCTHDITMQEGDARWVKMIARLIDANDTDAWLIKLADLLDNARSCHTMSPDRERFNKQTKVPLLLSVTKSLVGNHGIWKELEEFYVKSQE